MRSEATASGVISSGLLAAGRPIMRYHGGKWRIADWIISHFPEHKVYVEPFLGAGSVLLRKSPSRVEVGSDRFGRVVNVFRVLRDPALAEDLQRRLRFTACAEAEYHQAREISEDPVEDARRMIVLGHQAHGSTGAAGGKLSGWRRGVRPHGPTSSREWASLWESVEAWADRLRSVYIEQDDAAAVMIRWDAPDALHYVDPPYVTSTRTAGCRGYAHEMDDAAHRDLAAVLHSLRGAIILSGYRSDLYDELYTDWERIDRRAWADGGRDRVECLWLKNVVKNPELFSANSQLS